MENALRGALCVKGERGYSAYQVAVQNGFIGTEQDWLSTLGTSSHFKEETTIVTSTAGQTSLNLPSSYTSNSFIDVYVNGLRLTTSEYTINTSTKKINLVGVTLTAGQTVEIVVLTMATNALPIVETIDSNATNETAAGTKAVYNFVKTETNAINTKVTADINTMKTNNTTFTTSINNQISAFKTEVNNNVASKQNKSNVQAVTGVVSNIAVGATKTVDVAYPNGFTKAGVKGYSCSGIDCEYIEKTEDLEAIFSPNGYSYNTAKTGICLF
jgi:hypothetical protein